MALYEYSLAGLSRALAAQECSSEELTRELLARAEAQGKALNAIISLDAEKSLADARAADARIARGEAGPLTGIPIAHKDLFCAEGWRTTCGSRMLRDWVAPYDAHVIGRFKAAGSVLLAKANMDEFAMGSSNENSHFGPVQNPWDRTRVPGGSSGGSAALVAARVVPGATGTDTGGSIRQPAAFCGISGLRPTYGRVSRYGMVAFASSLDQGGPLAQTAEDLGLMLNVMAGFDERDSTSVERAPEDFTASLDAPLTGLRIGLPKEYFSAALAQDVAGPILAAIEEYKKLGATVVEVSLPNQELGVPVYYVIAPAEASSNLARFDGVRYGHRAEGAPDLLSMYKQTRAEGFGPEVKRRILVGTYVLSHGYYDAYYLQAQRVRRKVAEDFQAAFKLCDVIMGPVAPSVAFPIGAKTTDAVQMYLEDLYTITVNLAGLPGMSIPCGFGANGMPVGLQIIGNYFDEARMLNVAHQFQQVTDWHRKAPPEVQAGVQP